MTIWKETLNLHDQKFPAIDVCSVEPGGVAGHPLMYQAWADGCISAMNNQALISEFRQGQPNITLDRETIGKFCDWWTENYWGGEANMNASESGQVQIGWQCADCKAPVRDGWTCDVCDSGAAEADADSFV